MKLHHLFLVFILLFSSYTSIFSKSVDQSTALRVAKNFYFEHQVFSDKYDYNSIQIVTIEQKVEKTYVLRYFFKFNTGGFVIVSADDVLVPILAYGYEDVNDEKGLPENFNSWMNHYDEEILFAIENKVQSTLEIDSMWNHLATNDPSKLVFFAGKSVDPLLLSKWNQDTKYNALCPEDANGPGGRVYAGCVAVSMAQVMFYYKFPNYGVSNYSYYDYNYGNQLADFGNTQYKWNEMVNKIGSTGNFQVAQLLYHCGVAVDMMYSPSGSGAYTPDCETALESYFDYNTSLYYSNKSSMTNTQWIAKLKQNIDAKRPLIYSGRPSSGAGHAFNCDGYQGTDYFHFNWGWSGNYDGYFYVSNLNPNSNNFSYFQGAVFDIYPNTPYPPYCTSSKTLTGFEGVFEDGSGPLNYQNNQDCYWLIKPTQTIDHIVLSFDRFDLETALDCVIVYDGETINNPIIGKFSGSILPSSITSSGAKMLVRFISNQSSNFAGFDASYKSVLPVFCQGTKSLTDSIGSFSDGSGQTDYNNNSICKWMISPANAGKIELSFTAFDTEAGKDLVRVYDPTTNPSTLLAEFSGNTIPPIVISQNGYMLIVFSTGSDGTSSGWEANYNSVNVSLDENIHLDENLYPNPASDFVTIQLAEMLDEVAKLTVFSIDGKKVFETSNIELLGGNKIRLDIKNFKSGFYTVKLNVNTDIKYFKMLVVSKD